MLQVIGLMAGFTAMLFTFYSLVPCVLNWGGSAVLNLSLLSSNFWAALARTFLLGEPVYSAISISSSPLDVLQSSDFVQCMLHFASVLLY